MFEFFHKVLIKAHQETLYGELTFTAIKFVLDQRLVSTYYFSDEADRCQSLGWDTTCSEYLLFSSAEGL